MYETKVILSLIYRDYICTSEERTKLIDRDKTEIEKEKELLNKKYNIDFKNTKENKENEKNNNYAKTANMSLIEIKKEKWYKKIANRILGFFGKNKR